MNKAFEYPFDAEYIIQNRNKLKKELLSDGTVRIRKKLAVLGGSTTGTLVPILNLFLLAQGIEAEFYQSEYNAFREDAVFGNPELDAFAPDIVYIHTSNHNIRRFPSVTDSAEDVERLLDSQYAEFEAVWDGVAKRLKCPIIQNNFQPPQFRLLGNRDFADIHGRVNFINRLNAKFAIRSAESDGFYINDIAYLASLAGIDSWDDEGEYHLYKLSPCTGSQPLLAHSVACIVKAIFGKNKKVLALDLDNTLWGGVVGDVGAAGLEVGQESAQGQSYYAFQKYAKELSSTGIVLTVCSKNDPENALEGLRHPEGVLRPDDFAVIKANWERKDQNIAETAAELNLLPESFVFADDNPAERHIVASQIPGIAVPELDDPEKYIRVIDRGGYFESVGLSAEDAKRNEMYRQNAERSRLEASFGDYGEYLDSLEMVSYVGDFPEMYIKRISQLINKSNQFNLTTLRLTEEEVRTLCGDPSYIRLCGKLVDRFGDNGVVSIVFGKKDGDTLDIRLWLMSCRVLKRGMEQTMLCELIDECRSQGIKTVIGRYIPTAKNAMVKELYGDFGFTKIAEDESGETVWSLDASTFAPPEIHIKREKLTI